MGDAFEKLPPVTRSGLVRDLRAIGVEEGQVLMLHTRLSSLGYVIGGADTVVLALLETLGGDGTLLALSSWDHAPPDDDTGWSDEVRDAYRRDPPAFDVNVSESARYVGRLPERIRTWPGALRSNHPEASFVALGARARWLTAEQPFDHAYGPGSPLARVIEADGAILLLGAPLETITMLHHAEELANVPSKKAVHYEIPIRAGAGIEWRAIDDIDTTGAALPYKTVVGHRDSFEVIAEEALAQGIGRRAPVGQSSSVLLPARSLVTFAVEWIEKHFG